MLSIVTVASSTRMPTASARPPKVMMLSVSPDAPTACRWRPGSDSGIDVVTIRVERQLPRNSRIIRLVSAAAITPSRMTPWIEARTNMDWSPIGLISSASGSEGLMTSSIFLMPLTISSVEVEPFLNTLRSTERLPSTCTTLVCTALPLCTLRHVVHVHHGAVDALDRQVGEIRDLRGGVVQIDGVFVVADLLGARRRQQVLRRERVGDILAGQPERLHRARIEVVHDLRRLAAETDRECPRPAPSPSACARS